MRSEQRPRKLGRPTKFSPELWEKLCDLLAQGLTFEQACAHMDIHRDTYAAWCRDPKFSAMRCKAEAAHIIALEAKIDRNAVGWQRHAWSLERTFPQQFGHQNPAVQLTQNVLRISVDEAKAIQTKYDKYSREADELLCGPQQDPKEEKQ